MKISTMENWNRLPLIRICHVKTGKLDANAAIENGEYPFFTCAKEVFRINSFQFDLEAILLAGNNASGDFNVKMYKGKFNAYQRTYVIYLRDEWKDKIDLNLIFYQIDKYLLDLKSMSQGSNTKFIKLGWVQNIPILFTNNKTEQFKLLADLKKRLYHVTQMKTYAAIQNEAVEAMQGALLRDIFPFKEGDELPSGWKWEKVASIAKEAKEQVQPNDSEFNNLPFIGLENIKSHTREYCTEEYNPPTSTCFKFSRNNVLFGKLRPYLNKVFLPLAEGKCSMEILPLIPNNGYSRDFIAAILQSNSVIGNTVKFSTGGRMPRADIKKLKKLKVAIPEDVERCNQLGRIISEKIESLILLRKQSITQLEAIEALPAAILREAFETKNN